MEQTQSQRIILPTVMRFPVPQSPFPRIYRQVNRHCLRHGDVAFFDPTEVEWVDGTYQLDGDLCSIQNYDAYIKALMIPEGPGYPDYVTISYINEDVNCGVFAAEEISPGEFIGIYTGDLGYGNYHEIEESCYIFEMLDDEIYVDADRCGNFTRFINHSSPENCNCQSLLYMTEVNRFGRHFTIPIIILYASNPIEKGEQLLFDYGDEYWKLMDVAPRAITPKTYQFKPGLCEN